MSGIFKFLSCECQSNEGITGACSSSCNETSSNKYPYPVFFQNSNTYNHSCQESSDVSRQI